MPCRIGLPSLWIDASKFETAIRSGGNPRGRGVYEVAIRFPVGCKLMINVAIPLPPPPRLAVGCGVRAAISTAGFGGSALPWGSAQR